jgi:hypothetical protein
MIIPKEQITFAARLTGVFFGVFVVFLLISAVFGVSTPVQVASTFFFTTFIILGGFFYFIAPVLFIVAYIKPEWFGIVDVHKAMNRYGTFWVLGVAITCLAIVLVGNRLTLPDLSAAQGPITFVIMVLVVNTIMVSWISPVFAYRKPRTRTIVLAAVGVLTFAAMLTAGLV